MAANCQVEEYELGAGVERPNAGLCGRREGLVNLGWVVDVILNLSFRPDHAVGVPGGSGKARGGVGLAAVEVGSVDRGLDPVVAGASHTDGRVAAVDVLHHIEFSAGGPIDGRNVVTEQPERRPHPLRLRQHHLRLNASVLEAEEALRLEARRGIGCGPSGGLLRHNVQRTVCTHISIRTGRVAGASRRSPCTVSLQLVVAATVCPYIVGPRCRIGLRVGAGGIGEFV